MTIQIYWETLKWFILMRKTLRDRERHIKKDKYYPRVWCLWRLKLKSRFEESSNLKEHFLSVFFHVYRVRLRKSGEDLSIYKKTVFDKCSRQFGYLGRQLKRYFNFIWAKDKYTFHLCFHLCILTWVPESIHMYTHTHTHIQIYTCVFVYVIVCWCMCAYTFVCPATSKKHENKTNLQ